MNGIQVFDRPASQSFYAVAGRLLFIQSFDLSLATLIEQLFSGWQLTPVPCPERSPDIKISFFCGDSPPEIPAGLNQFEVAAGGRCYSAGDQYYLEFDNSLLHLGNGNPVGVFVWIKQLPGPTDVELARVTSFAVCAALRRFGLFELHSAGVVTPNTETGVLIIGPSGSGKSTLTLQLATAGWGYLSDDELLLNVVEGEVEARGFRSFFALAPETTSVNGSSTRTTKRCFEPAGVLAAPLVARVVPRFLLFSAISRAQKTQLRELTPAETMARLIRACPWATYDTAVAGQNLELLSQLARQAKGFNLMAGTDLLEPTDASRIISSVCRR
jgi:hypothetical protein